MSRVMGECPKLEEESLVLHCFASAKYIKCWRG